MSVNTAISMTTPELITPEKAELWLTNNYHNRPVRDALVREYARAMSEGRWIANGETIKIGSDGSVIDGQHRLWACVKSKSHFYSYIIHGLDSSVFDTIDQGKARTAGDILAIDGVEGFNAIAAAVKWIVFHERREEQFKNVRLDNDEIRAFVRQHPEIRDSYKAMQRSKASVLLGPAMPLALHYVFSKIDKDWAELFISDLGLGDQLAIDDPVYKLRERIIKDKGMRSKMPRQDIFAMAIRAWNMRRQSKPAKMGLKVTSRANGSYASPLAI